MYPLWNSPLWSIVTLESWRRNFVIPSRAVAFLGYLGCEVSYLLSFIRSSYDLSAVVPDSRIITYRVYLWFSDVMELFFKCSVDGDYAVLNIGDTSMVIFLMVTQSGVSLCWMDTLVPGGKGSWIGSVLFLGRPQVRPPSKRRELGKLVIRSLDSLSREAGGR